MLTTYPAVVSTYDELLRRSDNHPVLRWEHSGDGFDHGWAFGTAVAWTSVRMNGYSLAALGDPADAGTLARLVIAGDAGPAPAGLAALVLPAGAMDAADLPAATDRWDWEWYWTPSRPEYRPGESAVVVLDAADDTVRADIDTLIDRSSPSSSARPGDDDVVEWMGIRDDHDGTLIACAAHARRPMTTTPPADGEAPGASVLKAIATHPAHRGRGLGGDVTAAITRRILDGGAEVVTLGMYADNENARRLYTGLGYTLGQRFSSFLLDPSRGSVT